MRIRMNQMNIKDDSMHQMDNNLARLDLNLLFVLHALLITQSVSKAAQMISRTQPATSHALGRLRRHFGDPLLVRDGWQMQPTPLALSLADPVQQAIQHVQTVFEHAEVFDATNSTRRLRIATHDICVPLLNSLVKEISTSAPRMSVEFTSPDDFRRAVLHSEADLALAFGNFADDVSLKCTDLAELDWAVFAPKKHPYCETKCIDDWAASSHVAVSGQGMDSGPIEQVASRLSIHRHMLAFTPTFMSALMLAAQCHALFTTLRAPFEPLAKSLGLAVVDLPFQMSPARATYIRRSSFGNPFERWLEERISKTLANSF